MSNFPNTPSPFINGEITFGSGAVVTINAAPPNFCNSSAASTLLVSIYICAPNSLTSFSLLPPRDKATTRYPNLLAYWMARCPRPPSPCIATVEPTGMFIWRIELKQVTPAQRMGAYFAASTCSGIRTPASLRNLQYSASTREVSLQYYRRDFRVLEVINTYILLLSLCHWWLDSHTSERSLCCMRRKNLYWEKLISLLRFQTVNRILETNHRDRHAMHRQFCHQPSKLRRLGPQQLHVR